MVFRKRLTLKLFLDSILVLDHKGPCGTGLNAVGEPEVDEDGADGRESEVNKKLCM